ncbi:hypothetical protein STRMA_0355 [Streptococcus macacae NCTC 11558]|uniref:Uncharacterized protein n=1 Tax=Streptococcus macacae NCTC 11558 TaxID=764298 RepID=G5JYU1_9STRE|nr:hypothetical protein STRMA_0355 [Streptococcus macacae NCTC 11558]
MMTLSTIFSSSLLESSLLLITKMRLEKASIRKNKRKNHG